MRFSGNWLAALARPSEVKKLSTRPKTKTSWFYGAVLAYLLIFLALRLINLTEFPLNVDERRHIIRAQLTLAEGDIFIGLRESLKQLYIWLAALVLPFFRDHIFAARFTAVLTGVGAAAVAYKLGETLYAGRRIGALAALIYLVSPMALFYDRLAYTDTLLTMLMGAGVLVSFQLWRRPAVKWAVVLGVIFGLAALAKAYAVLYYPAPLLVWFFLGRNISWSRLFKLSAVIYGTTLVFWLPIFIVGVNIFQEDHTQKLITDLPTETWLDTIYSNTLATTGWLGGYLTLPLAGLVLFSLLLILLKRDRPGFVLGALLFIQIIAFILILRYDAARYLLPTIIPLSVIIAWGVDHLARLLLAAVGRLPWPKSPGAGVARAAPFGLLLLFCVPALRFDYLIVTDVPQAPLPARDRSIFVEGRFSGYGLEKSAEVVKAMAGRYPELIVLQGSNLMDTIFSLDVIGMSVYLQHVDNITYKEISTFDDQTLPELDRYARQAPTLTLGTFDAQGQPLPMFAPVINHPQAWPVASFTKPGGRHIVTLYQWLLWPDFALHWLHQAGDPDPRLAGPPAPELITAAGGTLVEWPQIPGASTQAAQQALVEADIEYVLLNATIVKSRPEFFAPFVTVDGSRLRFTRQPPDWYLAYAYPDLNCQWCLFYTRPPTHETQVVFAGAIRMAGYDLSARQLAAGETLYLTVYWQALAAPPESLVAFVHLLDEQGRLVGQVDQLPLQGRRPTDSWPAGHKLADRYPLLLDPALPPGDYTLMAGWYNAATLERLPVQSERQPISDNAVQLTTIRVE